MLNSCRRFDWMTICCWKFEGNLHTHVPPWAQQHMVDRHYSLNLKPWSARTLYVYAHADLAQKYSVGLQEMFVSMLCSLEENYFFLLCLENGMDPSGFAVWHCKDVKEAELGWYGYVIRKDEGEPVRDIMEWRNEKDVEWKTLQRGEGSKVEIVWICNRKRWRRASQGNMEWRNEKMWSGSHCREGECDKTDGQCQVQE